MREEASEASRLALSEGHGPSPRWPGRVLRIILRARFLYGHHLGWILRHRFLLLEHEGRRTGKNHATVVEVLRFDAATRRAVVMSGWGRSADWFPNIEANGRAEITIGRQAFPVEHRLLDEQEASGVLAVYESRNRSLRPIIRVVLSQLAGSKYDGSAESRRSVVQQLPIIALTPHPE